jgi:hypothetical protein
VAGMRRIDSLGQSNFVILLIELAMELLRVARTGHEKRGKLSQGTDNDNISTAHHSVFNRTYVRQNTVRSYNIRLSLHTPCLKVLQER